MNKSNIHATNVGTTATDVTRALDLRARVKEHPYGALAAAAGAGYVLGGGLFTRLTARTVNLALRVAASLAVVPLLEREVAKLIEAFDTARGSRATPNRPRA